MGKTTRKVDELGRFVIPLEVRQQLGIEEKSNLTILIESNRLILQKGQDVDELGRITIPLYIRQALGFKEYQELSIDVVENQIILTKQ